MFYQLFSFFFMRMQHLSMLRSKMLHHHVPALLSGQLDQGMLDGVTGQSGSGMDIKLGLDILTMGFHRSVSIQKTDKNIRNSAHMAAQTTQALRVITASRLRITT